MLYLILAACLIAIGLQVGPFLSGQVQKVDYEETFAIPFPEGSSLRLSFTSVAIHLRASEDDHLHAAFTGWRRIGKDGMGTTVDVVRQGSTFIFQEKRLEEVRPALLWSWDLLHGELTLRVPRGRLASLSAKSISGSLSLEGLEGIEMQLESTSGGISLQQVTAKQLVKASSTSGRVRAQQVQANVLSLGCTSGGVRAEDIRAASVQASSVSGGVSCYQALAKQLSAKSISGRVTVDMVEGGDVQLQSVSGGIMLTLPEDSGFSYQARVVSGRTSILFPHKGDRTSGVVGDGYHRVKAHTTSGSMTIKPRQGGTA